MLALAMEEGAEKALARTKATTAAVAEGRADALAGMKGGIVVTRPRLALAQLLQIFDRPPISPPGVHPSAIVEPTAIVGADAAIGPLCYVGARARIGARTRLLAQVTIGADSRVGEDCLLHSGVRIGDRCEVGHRVIVQANAVIGADGFSYVTPEKGSIETAKETGRVEAQNVDLVRINSIGNVEIQDEAEIGAGTMVARGTLGPTRIGRGTKIDNLVQVGHNCTIGSNCLIAGNVGLAGSVKLGDRVSLGGGVGIADHLTIGDDSILIAGSGVWQSIPPRQIWGGYPAMPWDESRGYYLHVKRLPRLLRDFIALRERVAELGKKLLAGGDARPGGRQG
jgi:UDP-3-O-[3-hydroxymyristoyl] glucosamine N-acyltransferase